MDEIADIIYDKIKSKREQLQNAKNNDNFGKCIWLEGQIFALENIYLDLRHIQAKEGDENDRSIP